MSDFDRESASESSSGTRPSSPSASHYTTELPYAEELQALLEGRYIVERFLGQGGMGAVYQGLQLPLKRPVAIKILRKQGDQAQAEDEFGFEERFKREAFAMAALTHPNIVQVYDCGDAGESFLFISMELVEGGDLSEAIKAGSVTPEAALNLMGPICDGLQAAHDRGLVHRDIKPANIFLTAEGRPKVADFGLAKKFDVKSTLMTKTGMGMGTPDYAAPEQYEGIPDIDHRADIYALGVMFYQMLTGSLPRGAYKAPSQRVAVDPRLDAVVQKAMEQDREERYQSAAELKADVQRIVATWMQPQPKSAAASASLSPALPPRQQPAPPATGRTGTMPARPQPHTRSLSQPAAPEKAGSGMLTIVLVACAAIAVGVLFLLKSRAPAPASAPTPDGATASSTGSGTSTASTTLSPTPPVTAEVDYAAVLTSPDLEWSSPIKLGPGVNGLDADHSPTLSADGLVLVFSSRRPGGAGASDMYEARRSSPNEPFGEPRALQELNTAESESAVSISGDGLAMVYGLYPDRRPADLYLSHRRDRNSPWSPRVSAGSNVNTPGNEIARLSHDGLTMLVSSARPEGAGSGDLYRTRRASLEAPWEPLELLPGEINTPDNEYYGALLDDGKTILFATGSMGGKERRTWLRLATLQSSGQYKVSDLDWPDRRTVYSPSLSADGRTLLCSFSETGSSQQSDIFQFQRVPKGSTPRVVSAPTPSSAPPPAASSPAPPMSAPTSAAAAPPAPAPTGDPRLAQLKSGFRARYESDAQQPYLSALALLNQSYVANGIARARATAQSQGALPLIQALDAEKASVEKGEGVPAVDAADVPAALKALRATYRSAVAKLEGDRMKKALPLYDIYLQALDAYVADLTRQNKIAEARAVQELRGDVADEKATFEKPATAAGAPAHVGSAAQAEIPASASDKVSAREIAKWALSKGGSSVTITTGSGTQRVTSPDALPAGKIEISELVFMEKVAVSLVTDTTLHQYVASATKLRRFRITNSTGITDRGMEAFRHLEDLEQLEFSPGRGEMLKNPGITNATFAHLSGLKKLRTLFLDCTGITGEGVADLASAERLERYSLAVGKISSEGMAQVSRLKSLKDFYIWWDPIKDEDLAHLKGLSNLENLDINSCGITGEGLAHLAALPKLRILTITGCRTNAFLKPVRDMPALQILNARGARASDAEFAELQAARPNLKINR